MSIFKTKLDEISEQCQQNYHTFDNVEYGDFETEYKKITSILSLYTRSLGGVNAR